MFYELKLSCHDKQWWAYDIYITILGYDSGGQRVHTVNSLHPAAQGGAASRPAIKAVCGPCHSIEIYLYAIASALPNATRTLQVPNFEAKLCVWRDGEQLARIVREVNPWGGLVIVAMKVGDDQIG